MAMAKQPEMPVHALPPVLDLACAEDLHQKLQEACAQDGPVTLNGAAVERVSTACLQLLVAAAISARARGLAFALHAPSPVLRAAVEDLGLAPFLPAALPGGAA
jgi:anti-anti-sigma regulatory factor